MRCSIWVVSLCAAVSLLSCSPAKKSETAQNTIVMGTNAEFPPFEFRGGADGQSIIGFDIEIAKRIAKKLNRELVIEDMKFDALLPALAAEKVDFVAAGMTINEERAKNIEFSSPYYLATQTVISRKGEAPFTDVKSLSGKKIATQLGTTGHDMAVKITGVDNVIAFTSSFEAIVELKNKKVDAVIIDAQPALNFANKNSDLTLSSIEFDPESYGIAVKKGNTELVSVINETIKELKENGVYDSLIAEYMK